MAHSWEQSSFQLVLLEKGWGQTQYPSQDNVHVFTRNTLYMSPGLKEVISLSYPYWKLMKQQVKFNPHLPPRHHLHLLNREDVREWMTGWDAFPLILLWTSPRYHPWFFSVFVSCARKGIKVYQIKGLPESRSSQIEKNLLRVAITVFNQWLLCYSNPLQEQTRRVNLDRGGGRGLNRSQWSQF